MYMHTGLSCLLTNLGCRFWHDRVQCTVHRDECSTTTKCKTCSEQIFRQIEGDCLRLQKGRDVKSTAATADWGCASGPVALRQCYGRRWCAPREYAHRKEQRDGADTSFIGTQVTVHCKNVLDDSIMEIHPRDLRPIDLSVLSHIDIPWFWNRNIICWNPSDKSHRRNSYWKLQNRKVEENQKNQSTNSSMSCFQFVRM